MGLSETEQLYARERSAESMDKLIFRVLICVPLLVPVSDSSVALLFLVSILLGMMFGLTITSKVTEERDAMQSALASFFPALLLSGVMWPVESKNNPGTAEAATIAAAHVLTCSSAAYFLPPIFQSDSLSAVPYVPDQIAHN